MGKEDNKSSVVPVYNSDYLVIQANELIRAKQDPLTLLEAKLLKFTIAQVLQADDDFKTFRIEVSKLAKLLKMPKNNIYNARVPKPESKEKEKAEFGLVSLTRSLLKKTIQIEREGKKKGSQKIEQFNWLQECIYEDGFITIRLHDRLKPYLLGLNELFTQYPYIEILELPTYNSMRLFELLSSYQNTRFMKHPRNKIGKIQIAEDEIVFTVEQLRTYFQCEDSYKKQADFISRVIDKSVTAINNKTVLRASYRTVKDERGRITHLVFKIGNIVNQVIEAPEKVSAGNE